jgi:hypothetical protein
MTRRSPTRIIEIPRAPEPDDSTTGSCADPGNLSEGSTIGSDQEEGEIHILSCYGSMPLDNPYSVPGTEPDLSPRKRGRQKFEPGKPARPARKARIATPLDQLENVRLQLMFLLYIWLTIKAKVP